MVENCEMSKPDHVACRSSLDFPFAEEKDETGWILSRENRYFKYREET